MHTMVDRSKRGIRVVCWIVAALLAGNASAQESFGSWQAATRVPAGPDGGQQLERYPLQGTGTFAPFPQDDQPSTVGSPTEADTSSDGAAPNSEGHADTNGSENPAAEEPTEDSDSDETSSDKKLNLGGWLATGYHNKSLPLSRARGDGRSFNDVPGSIELNQAWAFVERKASPEGDLADWGFRLDGVYGTDAQKTQAFGGGGWDNNFDNGVYGWAIPQLYGELAWGDTSVKIGHFFTPAGHEAVPSQPNFFYTRSLTSFNSEPFTHTGVLLAHELRDGLTVQGGWVAGWDTGFETAFNGNMFIAGLTANLSERAMLAWVSTAGNSGLRGSDALWQCVVFDWKLTEKLNYVAMSDLLRVNETLDDDVSLVQYLFYELNPRWKLGSRAEWWKDDGLSFWEWTSGINFTPAERLRIRTEVRHDVGPTTYDLTSFGIDAILSF